MVKYFILFGSFWISVLGLTAEGFIRVEDIDFKKTNDRWIQMEVKLSCQGNPLPEARHSRYVEKIKVKVYLAFRQRASGNLYDYYTSEVEIIIMEQGDQNNVYFYLPELIVERDQLSTTPDFYYVEISVNGKDLKPQKSAISSGITSADMLGSFVSKAESEGSANEHLLMPIYLTSGVDLGRVSRLPTFLRRDTRE